MSNSESTILTADEVRTIVERAFGADVDLLDYTLRPYSAEKLGFLGSHKNLEVVIQRSGTSKSEKHNFFAKIIPKEFERMESFVLQRRVFNQEASFYNDLVPILLEDYSGEPWAPRCYLANDSTVVLEDVRAQGFALPDSKVFNGERLKSAARAMARLHACSLLANDKLTSSLLEACVEQIFERDHEERGLFRLLVELAETIGRQHGRACDEMGPAFKRHHRAMQARPCRNEGRVISHADSWFNNFMFKSDGSCLLIDFQLVRYGKRAWDLGQLIYYNTTRELRQQEENAVVRAYHEEFNEVVRRHNPDLKLPSFSDTLEEYESARLHALFATMFYYPFLLLSKEESQKYGIEDLYRKFLMRESNEAVLDLMKRDEEYGRRITETALELIECCENLAFDKQDSERTEVLCFCTYIHYDIKKSTFLHTARKVHTVCPADEFYSTHLTLLVEKNSICTMGVHNGCTTNFLEENYEFEMLLSLSPEQEVSFFKLKMRCHLLQACADVSSFCTQSSRYSLHADGKSTFRR